MSKDIKPDSIWIDLDCTDVILGTTTDNDGEDNVSVMILREVDDEDKVVLKDLIDPDDARKLGHALLHFADEADKRNGKNLREPKE